MILAGKRISDTPNFADVFLQFSTEHLYTISGNINVNNHQNRPLFLQHNNSHTHIFSNLFIEFKE